MPMIRSFAAPPHRRCARLAGAAALALTAWIAPVSARTQFDHVGDLPGQGPAAVSRDAVPASRVESGTPEAAGAVRLRQPATAARGAQPGEPIVELPPYKPSEFERYVETLNVADPADPVRRFGANLLTDSALSGGQEPLPLVPGTYIIKPGDEIALTIWGAIDADLRLTVDRSGIISVPRIGAINVGGLRYADLANTIRTRVDQLFHNFQLTASLGQLRPIRVFVSGYAQRPGSITVSGLSSVLHAIMRAGGPSAAGSFRDIHLTRGGQQIATYDLYDLLLKDNRRADELVQPDDVIFIGPIGPQVAVIGSVSQQAIFELKPDEVLGDVLRMAGGFTAVADRAHVSIERLADRSTGRVTDLPLPLHAGDALGTGDVVWATSAVDSSMPIDRQNKRIHIDGEVVKPGNYVLRPESTLADAVRTAGGMTAAAYPYGAVFTRLSVRKTQQANYDRALRELETAIARADATQHVSSSTDTTVKSANAASNARLIERLHDLRPNGRIVLEVQPDDKTVPDLPLEDGDSLHIPARDTSVGVFGSVFNTGSFLFKPERTTEDYLHRAGGPTRGADKNSMFVIRANGEVLSAQQGNSFWHSGNEFRDARVLPGDTIFVPEELDKSTFVQDAKDWTQILYQFGLGIAGISALNLR